MSNVEIVPAILPKSFADLETHVAQVRTGAKTIQIDVVDGQFAHNKTWPYRDSGSFEKIISEEHGLPFWEDQDYEFDLMIEDPQLSVLNFAHAGALRIIVHANAHGAVEGLRALAELRQETGAYVITTGLALLPTMQPDVLDSFDTLFDYVQVMGIAHEGFQGQPFDHHAIPLIERLRRRYPDLIIQVDGAVKMENARALARAGANRLVVGSAIFGADDPLAALEALKREANSQKD
ncbi:MAG: ribulose-phosphate 3-epimerase [Parcubacteria group bacterium Gr01-1014_56]|nr:MAG: ribulose-phosphate 3-epimerase [Parcubacteria group bacterium Gr01-1014_56]